MKSNLSRALAAACAAAIIGPGSHAFAQLAAFPGALGFGANTTGARASAAPTVYHVTNLNDTGAGSFRDAVSQSNRIIVFDVGGLINIKSPVTCSSNLTILGQTAPGQGVGIYGAETSFFGKSNDIVRYMHFMDTTLDPAGQGTGNSSGNCINLGSTSNMIFDHFSCEFASYNNIDAAAANNLTFQNSIIADPIKDQQFNFHWEGTQGTFINNIFANSHNRSILSKGNVQFVNNTIYNYQAGFTTGNSSGKFDFDIVNNNFIAGPSTTSSGDAFYQVDNNQTAYASGNLINGSSANSVDGANVSNTPLLSSTASLPTLTATDSYAFNVAHSGDSLMHDPTTYATSLSYGSGTSTVDAQVISDVKSNGSQGMLWGNQSSTGLSNSGVGSLASGSIVSPNYSTLLNPLGYTMVEAWASQMSDSTLTPRFWTANGGEWNTPNNWSSIVPLANATPIVYDVAYVYGNGSGADGSLTVSTTTPTAYQLFIGGNGGAAGEKVQVTAGKLNVLDTITVGYLNTGVLQIDGGLVDCSNVVLGNTVGSTTYTGSLILNGGTLQMQQVALGGGTPGSWTTGGSITFNGGTLQAGGTFSVNAPAFINSATATIDTNGNSGTYSGVISGAGSVTKIGLGTVSLTGSNIFAGGVVLDAGELGISSDANIGGAAGTIAFQGGTLQIQGTALTNIASHPFNTSNFNGGFDIASAGNTFTVGQTLGGSGSFTLTGAGALQLTASNSYSGGTVLAGGSLIIAADDNLGANGSKLIFTGGVLEPTGTTFVNTLNHPIASNFNGGFNIASGNLFTISQSLTGSGSLTKSGAGVLLLPTTSTLSGQAILNGGTLRISGPLSLASMTVNFNTSGSSVDFNGFTSPTLGGITGGQNFNLLGLNPLIGNNNSSTSYTGVLSSAPQGGFTKVGKGTLTLTNNNTYSGPTKISGGTISISTLVNGGASSPLGASSNAQGNLILDGGTLQYTGGGGSIDRLFDLTANGGTLDAEGAGTIAISFTNAAPLIPSAAANVRLTLEGASTGHNYLYAALGDPAGGFTTSVTEAGPGKWSFNGSTKTYSGDTDVTAGTLETVGANTLSHFSNVVISSGATLDFHGTSQTINALDGAGTVTDSFEAGGHSFTIGANNASGSFSGNLGNATLGNVIKTGSGLQILSGTDTYTGTTTVTGGELQFNTAAGIGGTGVSITVNAGAAVAAGYAIDQTDFLNRITAASTGCCALAANSANPLNFSSAGLASVSLGAVGNATYTGTLTPSGTTYLLGGGGGTLTLPNTNALTGANNLQVVGPGIVSLTSSNNLTGITTVGPGGTLAVSTLANGGSPSSIGANSNAASNIVLDGGTLRYTGGGISTDRSFTLTANGGTLDGSGSGGIQYASPNPVAFTGTGNRTLALVGSESHSNFAMPLGDPASGQTSLTVNTASRWLWVTQNSTYSGNTTVLNGELELFGGGQLPSGTGKGNVLVDAGGTLFLTGNSGINGLADGPNGSGTVTGSGGNLTVGNGNANAAYSGAINGAISLTKTGAGTQTLTGTDLSYTGTTTVSGGTLTIDATNSTAAITATPLVTVQGGATLRLISVAGSGGNVQLLPQASEIKLDTTAGSPLLQLTLNNNTQTVSDFQINGVDQPMGLYNGTSAPAGATADEQYFSGNGTLSVVPEPGVFTSLIGMAAAGFLRRRRRQAQPQSVCESCESAF